jgi:hypothetical protein
MRRQITIIFICTLLASCTTTPSINVLGAYFPDWMFCILGAILATTGIHVLLQAGGRVPPPGRFTLPIIYSALTTSLALLGWLIFFKN